MSLAPEPTWVSVQATAMMRSWPLKSAAGSVTVALPSSPVVTMPDQRATVLIGVTVRPSPPSSSPPKLTLAGAPRLASSRRP